jgi:hypothetical protein
MPLPVHAQTPRTHTATHVPQLQMAVTNSSEKEKTPQDPASATSDEPGEGNDVAAAEEDAHRAKRLNSDDTNSSAELLLSPRWLTIGRINFQMFFCAASPLGDEHLRAAHTQLVQDCLSRHKVLCSLCMSPYPILFGSSAAMSVTYEVRPVSMHIVPDALVFCTGW